MVGTSYGLGLHQTEVPSSQMPTLVKVRPSKPHSSTISLTPSIAHNGLQLFLLPLQLGRETCAAPLLRRNHARKISQRHYLLHALYRFRLRFIQHPRQHLSVPAFPQSMGWYHPRLLRQPQHLLLLQRINHAGYRFSAVYYARSVHVELAITKTAKDWSKLSFRSRWPVSVLS